MRRICVVTGTRAEYGLMRWIMRDLAECEDVDLQILATGSHLSPEFGLTEQEILADGFEISARVEMLLSADTPSAVAKSMGLGVIGYADAYARLQPDALLLLGDRFEIGAAAMAALPALIPIGHIHGGERTEGVIDEPIRHAVSKMSHLHFTTTAEHRRRVVQLGEDPSRVFNVGAPGLDAFERLTLLSRDALADDLGFNADRPLALLTYHPVTLDVLETVREFDEILAALDLFGDLTVIATFPNADTHGRAILERLKAVAASQPERIKLVPSLGQLRYVSLLRQAEFVIGNSSSALIEAPSAPTGAVNVGDRQAGRVRAESVVDVGADRQQISAAIERVRSTDFRTMLRSVANPYGDGRASRRIASVMRGVDLKGLVRKRFHDLPVDARSDSSSIFD